MPSALAMPAAPVADAIRFLCPHCGKKNKVPSAYAGLKGLCRSCREPLRVPADGSGRAERIVESGRQRERRAAHEHQQRLSSRREAAAADLVEAATTTTTASPAGGPDAGAAIFYGFAATFAALAVLDLYGLARNPSGLPVLALLEFAGAVLTMHALKLIAIGLAHRGHAWARWAAAGVFSLAAVGFVAVATSLPAAEAGVVLGLATLHGAFAGALVRSPHVAAFLAARRAAECAA